MISKKLLLVAGIATLGIGSAMAAQPGPTWEEGAGLGTGVAVGLVAGGPIGGFVGGIAGALLGGSVREARKLPDTERELAATRGELAALQIRVADADLRLAEMRHALDQGITPTELGNGLSFDVLFRTGVDELTDADRDRVMRLGELLAEIPGIAVELDGYADPRGDAEYNHDLSASRVLRVSEILDSQGLGPDRVQTRAHGDQFSVAGEGDLDAYAFERRVSIRLIAVGDSSAVARSGDAPVKYPE